MAIILPDSPTLSIAEAAVVLGIGKTSAYKLADAGTLPTIRLGTTIRRVPTVQFLAQFGLAPTGV